MDKKEQYYNEIKNKTLLYKTKELCVDYYIVAIKRIDKAIEYINREDISIDIRDEKMNYISTNELLEILKGKSE